MTDGRMAGAEALTHVSRQVVGVVLVSWQRTLRVGLITAAVTLLVAEIVACLVTGSFPPPPSAHLVTGALAVVVGYSVALTTLFALLLRGGVRFIRHLEGDLTIGAEAASVFARREVGDLGAGLRTRVEDFKRRRREKSPRPAAPSQVRPALKPRPPIPARGIANPVAVVAVGLDVARIAMPRSLPADIRRDPEDAIMRTPPSAMQSLPVLAARLPRIGWTYDEQTTPRPPTPSGASATASPAPSPNPAAFSAPADQPDAEAPEVPDAHDLVGSIPDAPGLIPRGWRRSDATTRPLAAVTRPLPTPSGARSGSLWDRVSQALVGQTQPEPQPADAEEIRDDHHAQRPPVPDDGASEDAWLNE